MNIYFNLNRIFILSFIVAFPMLVWCQDNISERIVEGEKTFNCTSDKTIFKTAEEGCAHWAQVHLPEGYKFGKVVEITPESFVKCLSVKEGSADNEQVSSVRGIIICPENASEYIESPPADYQNKKCLCYTNYIADPSKKKCIKKTYQKNKKAKR